MATTIIFIDSKVTGFETLISDLPLGSEWHLLAVDLDGVEQIASFLDGRTGVDSIQIVSHGSAGALFLGSSMLDAVNMWAYQDELVRIGSAMTPDGDLLLLGCDVAQGNSGQFFIDELSRITGADVAASTGPTGLGGNWLLEAVSGGLIENSLAITDKSQQAFASALGLITLTQPASFSEDGASDFQFVLNVGPAFDVEMSVTLAPGLAWPDGSLLSKTLTFTPANWFNYQTVTFKAVDDLDIEGDLLHLVTISTASSDPTFNGLSEARSVTVIDNDFQRTLEPAKYPSAGNNYIIYDALSITSAGTYDLSDGTDKLEVSASLAGSLREVRFVGGLGNDSLSGVGAADGGAGNDVIVGSTLGYGVQTMTVYQLRSTFSLGSMSRVLTLPAISEQLAGGTGDDVISAALSMVQANLAGGDGNDTITGSAQDDVLYGDSYNATGGLIVVNSPSLIPKALDSNQSTISDADVLRYYKFSTSMSALTSSDWWSLATAGYGADSIDGGAGNDTISSGGGDDTVLGGLGADNVDAGAGADLVSGGDGNDTIWGYAGNDTITGGLGDDSIDSGDGDDSIDAGEGNNSVSGGKGFDRIVLGSGADRAWGGDDNDTITGAAGNDSLHGDAGNDALDGSFGNDALDGGLGQDTMTGGEGNDSLIGGSGDDLLFGDEGLDTLVGGDGNDQLFGGLGIDSLLGGAGNDTLDGGDSDENDTLDGGEGNDRLLGWGGVDVLSGAAGNDTLLGGEGADTLWGGLGDDQIQGGGGSDAIYGGAGLDILTGSSGVDSYVFTYEELEQQLPDVITDFQVGPGGDKIDFSDIHAKNILAGYTRWPAAQLPYTHGYIRLVQDGVDVLIGYDRDGHNNAHNFGSVVRLQNTDAMALTSDNFSLVADNFGLSRNGVVAKQTVLSNTSATLDIRLWGGQPSANVEVKVYDARNPGVSLGSVVYTPADWTQTKSLGLTSTSLETLDLSEDLVFSLISTDIDYSGTNLVMGIVGDNLVAERQRLIAPELSIFSTDQSAVTINLSSSRVPADLSSSIFTLVPDSADLARLSATFKWVAGVPQLVVANPGTWVGNELFTAVGKIDGVDVQIPITLRNLGSNTLTVSSLGSVLEGQTTSSALVLTLALAKPAGETISVNWKAALPIDGSVNAVDFMSGIIPEGTVTFERGETFKVLTIYVAGDSLVEKDEVFSVDFSVVNSPVSMVNFIDSSEIIVIKNDDLNEYLGTAKYWNNDKPLDLLTGWVIEPEKYLNSDLSIIMKNINYDSKSNILTAELWIKTAETISNLDIHFIKPDGVTVAVESSSSTVGWTLIENDVNGRFDMAGIGDIGISGEMKLYEFSFSNFKQGQELQVERGTVGNTILTPTNFKSAQVMKIDDGMIALSSADKALTLIDFTSPASTQSLLAIDSRDALMALKMANGTLSENQLFNPLQWVAADVNKSGTVSALDAWHILREIVGLGTANVGDWQIVNGSVDASRLSADNAWLNNLDDISPDVALDLVLIGVIRGDIDGTWGVY